MIQFVESAVDTFNGEKKSEKENEGMDPTDLKEEKDGAFYANAPKIGPEVDDHRPNPDDPRLRIQPPSGVGIPQPPVPHDRLPKTGGLPHLPYLAVVVRILAAFHNLRASRSSSENWRPSPPPVSRGRRPKTGGIPQPPVSHGHLANA
ncbi:hypothetical protein MS3_00011015 [Schistosoma haematobium]|uniref:Uncharacterized protein n=1 Tax=Schistosoma haematobium TaxID=6185 RepID=A0A922LF20_SCHHA|nr:hypothetical protein MS3_00011015 [Schistosoma haematobium]KAH9581036.1 hypothetical protein MS3_00011015 [Schistosoma haematobium]